MRTPWPNDFPLVFAHSAWQADQGRVLPDHPGYWPAKKKRDAAAALRVLRDLHQECVLEQIHDLWMDVCPDEKPIIAAPAMTVHESQNYLAIGHARWLGAQMGWDVDSDIFQARTMARDFTINGWFRLVQQPRFYGTVQAGRTYVLADDVCTMGGTLANLRGFIEAQGGHVMCMTVIATSNGTHNRISLAEPTQQALSVALGGGLGDACQGELGYEARCLTEQEGRFLLRCPSLDDLRAGIDGARNS